MSKKLANFFTTEAKVDKKKRMAKISYKLDTRRPLSDGTYPLKISISQKGKTVLVPTEVFISEDEWAEMQKGLSGKRRMNARERVVNEAKTKMDMALTILSLNGKVDRMDVNELKTAVLYIAHGGDDEDLSVSFPPDTPDDSHSLFLPYYIEQMESKDKQGTRDIYAFTLKLIRRFEEGQGRNPENLSFKDITPSWLLDFDNWMSPTNGVNSRSKNMRNIRSVFNSAIDEGMRVEYPFSRSGGRHGGRIVNDRKRKFKIKTNYHTPKRALTVGQLRALRDYPCAPHQEKYRDFFMLMFYLIGINAVDLFTARPGQLVNGRLEYDREKTGRPYSIKVEPEAMAIIRKYRGEKYLLDPCDRYRDYTDFLHRMNEQLKLIGVTYHTRQKKSGEGMFPGLSTYWARHTWSTIAMGVTRVKDTVGKALGHSWAMDSVTDIYINMDPRIIDEANRAVLDFVAGSEEL